jgi:hypothetical protein
MAIFGHCPNQQGDASMSPAEEGFRAARMDNLRAKEKTETDLEAAFVRAKERLSNAKDAMQIVWAHDSHVPSTLVINAEKELRQAAIAWAQAAQEIE